MRATGERGNTPRTHDVRKKGPCGMADGDTIYPFRILETTLYVYCQGNNKFLSRRHPLVASPLQYAPRCAQRARAAAPARACAALLRPAWAPPAGGAAAPAWAASPSSPSRRPAARGRCTCETRPRPLLSTPRRNCRLPLTAARAGHRGACRSQ